MSAFIPASEYVTETVALVLRLERRKMGVNAAAVFKAMENGSTRIYIPGLVLAEILYLSEKRRITASLASVADYLKQYSNCVEYPMSLEVAESAAQITDIPELHDRLIAATAHLLSLSLI